MSCSAPTTFATSSSSPRSTSMPRRWASTSPRPSSPPRTTPSRSPTCRRPTSSCAGGRHWTASASTTPRPSSSPMTSRSTWSRFSRRTRSMSWCPTCRWGRKRPTSSTPSARSTPAWPSSTRCRCSSLRIRCGPRSSPTPACRLWVTTSRVRSAPPSLTESWPSCSRIAACNLTAPCSSTSAAIWTFSTCLSVHGWSRRRSPRPRPSRPTCRRNSMPRMSTLVRPITWAGSMTASGPMCVWKVAPSVTCR